MIDTIGLLRSLTEKEIHIIHMLREKSELDIASVELADLQVQEMPDGGMGSLYIVSADRKREDRFFEKCIADIELQDIDGALVIVSLNVDQYGVLFELDIWRVDYNPVIDLQLPH
ncbi:MAG TPA: hypothetical protein VHP34_10190 [Alphaproteobacteria bacterium]|nr:hypothetical protein [Alphaproteobacteria bacterium]